LTKSKRLTPNNPYAFLAALPLFSPPAIRQQQRLARKMYGFFRVGA